MKPTISITIPCRNEENYIAKCINSILDSNYPKDKIKVFVCDGLSTDKTPEIVAEITKNYPNVVLIKNNKQTTPFALNLGLQASDCDIKIILGAHAEIDKEFISENVKVLEQYKDVGCAGGILENVYENSTAEIIGLAMSSSFGVGNAHFRTGNKDGYVDTVAFGAYRKEVFEKIGYFDEDLARNQDDEFNYRLLKNDFKIYLSNDIKSKYYVRGSFKKLFKQYYQYGYWKVYVNKKHKTITTIRQLIPLFFILFLFIGSILSLLHWIFLGLFLLGATCYLLLALFFAVKKTKILRQIFKVSYTFILLHISYGTGYLMGLLDFIILNKNPRNSSSNLTR